MATGESIKLNAPASVGFDFMLLHSFAIFAFFIAHLAAFFVDLTCAWHRLPAPVMATGIAGVFLVVQLLMPQGGAAFIYFQF